MITCLASKTTVKLLLMMKKFMKFKKSKKINKKMKNLKMIITLIRIASKVSLSPNKLKRQKTAKTLAQKYNF